MKLVKLTSLPIILLIILGITGCEDSADCCTIIDVDVQLYYKNALGENLINSTDDFDESNIKVYYKNGNNYDYIYNGNLDAPNMHSIYENENGKLILTVYPSNFYEGDQSTTLIEISPNIIDTLVCEFDLDDNREVCKTAWLNGVELENRYLEIEK